VRNATLTDSRSMCQPARDLPLITSIGNRRTKLGLEEERNHFTGYGWLCAILAALGVVLPHAAQVLDLRTAGVDPLGDGVLHIHLLLGCAEPGRRAELACRRRGCRGAIRSLHHYREIRKSARDCA